MNKSCRFAKATLLAVMLILMSTGSLLARPDKLLDNSRYDLIRLDTLGYKEIYLPAELKYDFPYDISGSRAIKDAYKAAKEEGDGYMIYMLSILEWDKVFTYGNLNAGKMLFEAFNIAEADGDARLTLYVLAQQMRFNLFSFWYTVDFFRHAANIVTTAQDPTALLELADYAEDMKYDDPDPVKLRALAYGIMDKVQIRNEEFEVFWDNFKTCCKDKDAQTLSSFINSFVLYQESNFGEIYNNRNYYPDELVKDFDGSGKGPGLLPAATGHMDSVAIGKPVKLDLGEAGSAYWSLGRSYENPGNEFVYEIGKYGPVSYSTSYCFKKFDGKIKLYMIVYDEF